LSKPLLFNKGLLRSLLLKEVISSSLKPFSSESK
jgi:hypothetical protein